MRPTSVPSFITRLWNSSMAELTAQTKTNYQRLLKGEPEVTVVIPAYNEENSILYALESISANNTRYSVEIIVANNNSTDNTEAVVKATGIPCILETIKGPTAARTAGLGIARGKYMLNADADSVYPPDWIERMIAPLEQDNGIAITYGRFAFMPSGNAKRITYFFYEHMADILRWQKKTFREEAMNVYGCNSGFRREQCLKVNGYEHPPGSNEDGYLALKLRNNGFGRLHYVNTTVWTVDRHLQKDGGLWKSLIKRVKGAFS